MIKAKNLSKKYGNLKVLNNVDLVVKEKEIVAITGPSGAGKTTLLNILGTLDTADHQPNTALEIDGVDLFTLKGKALARFRNQQLGFVFQSHQLLPEFSAIENVCIPAMIAKKPIKKVLKDGMELLSFLGLNNRADHKPAMLSGGEQQRVAVARALINKPKLLLADEPSGNLDSKTAAHLHKLFLSLRNNFDQTIVLVTHNKEFAALGDRSLQLVDGQWS
ncbi:MAG: ABC transporter ATP-binding protein [Bacteroidota bacterium]|nr:ABC transporter ATP-binding protein [Bacteroidota bacterium]